MPRENRKTPRTFRLNDEVGEMVDLVASIHERSPTNLIHFVMKEYCIREMAAQRQKEQSEGYLGQKFFND